MFGEEEVSEDGHSAIFVFVYREWIDCEWIADTEIAVICQNGGVLDIRVPDYFELFDEK